MRKIPTTVLLAAALWTAALSAQTSVPVTIHVTDQTGAAIAGALGRITSAGNADVNLQTDIAGESSANLAPGIYSLSIAAPGFKTETRRIAVAAGEPRAGQVVSVILRIGTGSGTVVYSSDSLLLTGDPNRSPTPGQASIALTPIEFHALPHVALTVHNSHTDTNETYSGVPLASLLAKIDAPTGNELRGDAMASYLVATGSDGYSVVLSLAEVDPAFRDTQVIVADTRDGQPLGKNGPFQLIVQADKRPARWVRNLVSISLKRAQ